MLKPLAHAERAGYANGVAGAPSGLTGLRAEKVRHLPATRRGPRHSTRPPPSPADRRSITARYASVTAAAPKCAKVNRG
jgi:hypothetical protein